MKKINLFIIGFLVFILGCSDVFAGSFSITPSKTTVNTGESYTVKVKYTGVALGSAKFNVQFNNVNCTGSSDFGTVVSKCSGSSCEVTLGYAGEEGYKSGSTLYKLSCKSNNAGTSKFSVALSNGDAYDNDVNEVSVSSASTSVKVVAKTTTTTTTTTTQTTRRTTTKSTTKSTTSKKASADNKTTKKTTIITTTKKNETSTTKVNEIQPQESTTTSTTSVVIPVTQESTTKLVDKVLLTDDVKLESLKVVGYPFNFKPNKTNYTIVVDESVDEIYIEAKSKKEDVSINNVGIVNIYAKNEVIVKVYNKETKKYIDYTIKIERRSYNDSIISFILNNSKLILLFGSLAIIVSLVLIFLIRRTFNKDTKLERINNIHIDHSSGIRLYKEESANSNNGIVELNDEKELTRININK